MSNWIDAHLHLTDARVEASAPALIADAAARGIARFILGGVDPEEWDRQKRLHTAFPERIVPVFGLHPWWIASRAHDDRITPALARLSSELEASPRICRAVGETGLDFHPRFQQSSHALQETVFREHLRLARLHHVPVVLHVVRAHERALTILREERRDASSVDGPEPYRGIVHSFSEGPEIARAYLELGLVPSISASVITRGRGSAFEKLRQTVVTLSATAFVLETDSPDQPPAGVSGLNLPTNLVTVAEAVARHRGMKHPGTTAAELLDASTANLRRIFDL